MNDKQAAKWAAVRNKGKGSYIMYRGVLPWGIGFAVLFSLIELLTQGTLTWYWLVIRLVVFAVIGFLVAVFRWEHLEQKFAGRNRDKTGR
jgi:hypothetical protein